MNIPFAKTVQTLFNRNPGFTAILRKPMLDEVEHDFSNSDLEIRELDVPTKRDLPLQGKASIKYRTLDDMSIWSWVNGKYVEYNPYSFGITQEYNEARPQIIEKRLETVNNKLFEDERHLASISIDQVRNGSDPKLAMLYNLDAFREDIRMITQYGIAFTSMLPDNAPRNYFRNDAKQNLLDNWFAYSHAALHLLLRSSCRSATHLDKNMIDGLHGKGAHLWWDAKTGNAKFKDGEFEVNI